MYKSEQEMSFLQSYRAVSVEIVPASLLLDENLTVIKQRLLDQFAREKSEHGDKKEELVFNIGFLGIPNSNYLDSAGVKGSIYPIRLSTTTILLGPLYHPEQKQGPCPHCLERRWLENRSSEE